MNKATLLFLTLVACVWTQDCMGQFYASRSHFLMSGFIDNPAAVGNNPCLDMRLGVRSQWLGFEGAPLSTFASLSGRVGTSENWAHGLGGFVQTDEIGPWSNTRFSMSYASKIRLTNGARLSAGLAAGLVQYKLDVGSLSLPNPNVADDPAIVDSRASEVVFPNLDFGLWYEDKTTFAAVSVLNLTEASLTQIGNTTAPSRCMVLMGGKVIKLDKRFSFRPAAQMRITQGLPVAFDAQGMFTLDKVVSMGAGYRNGTALVGLLNLKVFDSMSVGYAYDFGVSRLSVGARHSHEIVISLTACDDTDPYTGANGRCSAYD